MKTDDTARRRPVTRGAIAALLLALGLAGCADTAGAPSVQGTHPSPETMIDRTLRIERGTPSVKSGCSNLPAALRNQIGNLLPAEIYFDDSDGYRWVSGINNARWSYEKTGSSTGTVTIRQIGLGYTFEIQLTFTGENSGVSYETTTITLLETQECATIRGTFTLV